MPVAHSPRVSWKALLQALRDGHVDDAERLCERALATRPQAPRWLLGRAWCRLAQGRLDEALALAEQVVALEPDDAAARRTAALARERLASRSTSERASANAANFDERTQRDLFGPVREAAPVPRRGDAVRLDLSGARPQAPQLPPSRLPAVPTPPPRQDATSEVERLRVPLPNAQLQALYGASLFGAWPESLQPVAAPGATRLTASSSSWRLVALGGLALVLLAALGAIGVVARQRAERRELVRVETELRSLLRVGSLPQLAALLDQPTLRAYRDGTKTALRPGLWRRAAATLYRYVDGSPARRRAAERGLVALDAATTYDDIVTGALLLSENERAHHLAALRRAARTSLDDPQAWLLLATTERTSGHANRARQALENALRVEPSNLLVLVEEVREANGAAVLVLADQARDIDPSSPWVGLIEHYAAAPGAPRGCVAESLPAMVRAEHCALDVVSAWKRGADARASETLERAFASLGSDSLAARALGAHLENAGLAWLVRARLADGPRGAR